MHHIRTLTCQFELLDYRFHIRFGYYLLFIQCCYYHRLGILQARGVQLLPRSVAFDLKSPSTIEQPITISYLQIFACNLDQIRHHGITQTLSAEAA
jgi:hypothetical protein